MPPPSGHRDPLQIAHDVKRTVAAMLRDGIPRRQIVGETSALYGIPQECVEEVILASPPQLVRGPAEGKSYSPGKERGLLAIPPHLSDCLFRSGAQGFLTDAQADIVYTHRSAFRRRLTYGHPEFR